MNRELWDRKVLKHARPSWPCPVCKNPTLQFETDSFSLMETPASKKEHKHPDWEPHWIDGRFTCTLVCTVCHEPVCVAGRFSEEEWATEKYQEEVTWLEPKCFVQAPPLILMSDNIPVAIREEIEKTFPLYWLDLQACANRIRSAVELILTDQGVRRTRVTAKGKRLRLSLHERIDVFASKNKDLAHCMEAAKWVGNSGSHLGPISTEDVLDGFELLEHTLSELYDKRVERIRSLARQINRHKKPRSSAPLVARRRI